MNPTPTVSDTVQVHAPRTIQEPHATEQEAREVAEAARETEWTSPSFLKELFGGNLRLDLIHPGKSGNDRLVMNTHIVAGQSDRPTQ